MNRVRLKLFRGIQNFLYAGGDEPSAVKMCRIINHIFSTQVEMNRFENRAVHISINFLYAGGDEPSAPGKTKAAGSFSLRRWR